jgi:ribonuclease HI
MRLTPEQAEELIKELGLHAVEYLIVADGAGGLWADSCGYQATIYGRQSRRFIDVQGSGSHGTNNYAELAPFIHAFWTLDQARGQASQKVAVGCVTDSEVTAYCGSGRYGRKANLSMWASIEWFEKFRFELYWRHVPRNSNPFSEYADGVAKRRRKSLKGAA